MTLRKKPSRENESVKVNRPEWLDNDKFINRVLTIFRWHGKYGKYEEAVDEALIKIFGRNGPDLLSSTANCCTSR